MTLRQFLQKYNYAFKVWDWFSHLFSEITWPRIQAFVNGGIYYKLSESQHDKIRELLKENYYIILTRRSCHFSTYMVALISYVYTGKMSHYTHTLMNVEGDITNNIDFKLIEATAPGVGYSTFMNVFDCDSVVLLKPKNIDIDDWTTILDIVKKEYGLKYDTLFDISNEEKVSCVEMVYQGLKKINNFEKKFPALLSLIAQHKNDLTPQMLYDCGDFDIVLEVRL